MGIRRTLHIVVIYIQHGEMVSAGNCQQRFCSVGFSSLIVGAKPHIGNCYGFKNWSEP